MRARRPALLIGLVAVAAACGSAGSARTSTGDTLAIGGLPPVVSSATPADRDVAVTTPSLAPGDQVGARVSGNKVILIGDSVMASTATRYGGEMCKALVPLGWQTEVDAETGQFVPWGHDVLDARLSAKWDVAVILLGNNYLGDQDTYRTELERMITRLTPTVVVLLRVTEFTPNRRQVNAVIDGMAATHSNVLTIDWAAVTGADGSLTGHDGLHLTNKGRARLAAEVAKVLGQAPVTPGDCLKSKFTDDSRGPVTGTTTTVKGDHTSSTSADTTVPATEPPTSASETSAAGG